MIESFCFGVLVVGLMLWIAYEMICEYRRLLSDKITDEGNWIGWLLFQGTLRKVSR